MFLLKTLSIGFLFLFTLSMLFSGCASSNVSRQAAANMDMGERNAKSFLDPGDTGIADSYQNASQTTKGAIIGGTTGAVTGAFSSVGFIPGTAAGLILGASYGSYIDANTSLQDQLENRGATVVVLGDQILIVLSSDRIFHNCSASVKSQAISTLNLTARYINNYTKMLVTVAAYTDTSGSSQRDLYLSQQQAQNVARVLMANGMDARVLYAIGYGNTHLVEKTSQEWDGNQNYRIEITLEKLYV